jgi:cytochrome c biogenesis protein CcmG, thiol:disulfide interchange protein DsbE
MSVSSRAMRPAIFAGLALAALGCGPGTMPPSLGHPLAGEQAPEFREIATEDRDVGLPGNPGTRATVIDFWASWCTGCRESIPAFDDLWRDKHPDGVMVIGVSVDESTDDALLLAQHLHATFPIVLDPHMRLASTYAVGAVPLTFVVDRRGTIRWVGRDPGEARAAVRVLLSE